MSKKYTVIQRSPRWIKKIYEVEVGDDIPEEERDDYVREAFYNGDCEQISEEDDGRVDPFDSEEEFVGLDE